MTASVFAKKLRIVWALLVLCAVPLLTSCAHIPGLWSKQRALVGEGIVTRTDTVHCLNLLPENALHRIIGCETPSSYTVLAPGQRSMVLAKAKFKQLVRAQVRRALEASVYPTQLLGDTELEIWLLAPVFEPEKLQWVIVVNGMQRNFALHLPFNPQDWDSYRTQPLLLGSARYPSRQSWQAGVVLLEANSFVSRQATVTYLAQFAHRQLDTKMWPLVKMHIRSFAELDMLRLIQKSPDVRDYLLRASTIPAGEAEAVRGLLYRFAWRE